MRNRRIKFMSVLVVLLAITAFKGFSQDSITVPDNTNSPMGVNFWFFNDYQYTWPFVDFFKTSRQFWPQPAYSTYPWYSVGPVLSFDKDGYPDSLPAGIGAATLMFWSDDDPTGLPIPKGDFVCLYDGVGQITFAYNATIIDSSTPGRLVVRVGDSGGGMRGVLLKISQTNPANHIHNIRFICPGFENVYATQPFHPQFLSLLKPFRVIRFMDWMSTNTSTNIEWADRSTPTSQTQATSKGVALEHMIALCNALNADPWFNIPNAASDDFVSHFAQMVKDSLKPNLKAYFEYSNEVWNGQFPSRYYTEQEGDSLGLGSGWGACVAYWATRSTQIMKIVEGIYGDQLSKRVVRVLGSQAGNTGVADGLLTTGDTPKHHDVLAIAPYFGVKGGTVDIAVANAASTAPGDSSWIVNDLAEAVKYNLRLVTYESGLDVSAITSKAVEDSVRFDPRMNQIYYDYLTGWKKGGGSMIMQYTFCDPSWGLMHDQLQSPSQAPMYQAALKFISNNPRWWDEDRFPAPASVHNANRHSESGFSFRVERLPGAAMPDFIISGPKSLVLSDCVVFDLNGKTIGRMLPVGDGQWIFPNANTSSFSRGVYLVRMKTMKGTFVTKFLFNR